MKLQEILKENDTDGDGTLSIEEIETFHSRMIRKKMVDRFQHLDADGNGAINSEEIVSPADKIEQILRKMKAMNLTEE